MKFYIVVAAVFTVTFAKQYDYTTPVPILKQINRQNEDGSYSYGYEAADGTYKIETKYPNGEVYGKYGYLDDQGKLRTVEYGASRRGFEPAGNEIQVPPPTLQINQNAASRPLAPDEEDDGQYREDPGVYYKNDPYARDYEREPPRSVYDREPPRSLYASDPPRSIYAPRDDPPEPAYRPPYKPPPSRFESKFDFEPALERSYQPSQPAFRPQPSYQPSFRPTPAPSFQQSYRPSYQQNYAPSHYNPPPPPPPPAYPSYNPFHGAPAQNVDIFSGSYTVNYR